MPRRPRHTPSRDSVAGVSPQRPCWLLAAGLMLLVAAAYWPVWRFDFVSIDDPPYVSDNPHLVGGLTLENIAWAFTTRWASYWIPLTWLSYMAEATVFGIHPGVHHVTNVVLHGINTLLLLGWLRRETGALGPSAFVAAMFALHPLHVESVAWITERKDVLSTLFLLLALRAYTAWARRPARTGYVALCAWLVLGSMAKPMLVTLPIVLLLCDVWPLQRLAWPAATPDARRLWREAIVEKWPIAAIALVMGTIVYLTQEGARVAQEVFPFGLRLANAIVSYVMYLWQTVWPVGLVVNYPYPASIPIWRVAAAAALLVTITVVVIRLAGRRPYLAMAWLWYLVTLGPVIGLVQVGLQPRADRFTYVPLIGVFIALAWAGAGAAARAAAARGAIVASAVALTLVAAIASRRQLMHWENAETLWRRGVAVTPPAEAAQMRFELGAVLLRQGRTAEAIPHFQEAVRVQPSFAGAHAALGDALSREGRRAEAKAAYEAALRLDDGLPEIHNNLGAMLATEDQLEAALPHFEAAVRQKPDLESARVNLGVCLVRLGRVDDGKRELQEALRLNPGNAQARRVLELVR